jgi:hypothetical protein
VIVVLVLFPPAAVLAAWLALVIADAIGRMM